MGNPRNNNLKEEKNKEFIFCNDHNSQNSNFPNGDYLYSVSDHLDKRMYYKEEYDSSRHVTAPSSHNCNGGPYSLPYSYATNNSNFNNLGTNKYQRTDALKYYKHDYDARYVTQSTNLYKSNIPSNEVKKLNSAPSTINKNLNCSTNIQLDTHISNKTFSCISKNSNFDWPSQESESMIKNTYTRNLTPSN